MRSVYCLPKAQNKAQNRGSKTKMNCVPASHMHALTGTDCGLLALDSDAILSVQSTLISIPIAACLQQGHTM